MPDFKDRVVVVSGAAGNLGGVVSHAFAALGAHMALLDRRPGRLQEVCGQLADDVSHLLIGTVDMTDADSVENSFQQVIDKHGRVDILINAIGGFRGGTPIHETSLESWDFMFELNARSVFLSCRAAVPQMLKQGSGKIVNIGARPGVKGAANAGAYSGAKSAVIRLTESLSEELKEQGINVNSVLPGHIDTPENREQTPEADFSRWVAPSAVVEVILFLASEAASAVHGAAIPAYGTG
ncbi:MAG: SDR family NAD(P)-dependent oxidoreductase [Anaerolineales bacterium]